MNTFNITKIIRLILSQDSSWLFSDHSLRIKLRNPFDMFKISNSSTHAVIVHICIDGLTVISFGWCAGYAVWEILTFSLSVSPPVPHSLSLPPPFISHLQFLADLPPSLKSLWISENIPRLAVIEELILTLCCYIEDRWACKIPTLSYDRFII